jgi:hypothetical protein
MGRAIADYSLGVLVLDRLLLVPMMIELLHTVRISVRSEALIIEQFLVIAMQAPKMTGQGQPQAADAASAAFRNTMVESRNAWLSESGSRKRDLSLTPLGAARRNHCEVTPRH